MTTDDTAPSFPAGGAWRSKNYPLKGVKTGPAWRAMWKALGDLGGGEWAVGEDLMLLGADAGGCSLQTARLLLIRAGNAGVVERKGSRFDSRTRTVYRRASMPYRMLVDLLADGKYAVVKGEIWKPVYLDELVDRGVLERRARNGEYAYRLTWKPPAAVK